MTYRKSIDHAPAARASSTATPAIIAFDVLASVDAVGSEFHWELGSGHCGKGQPAKVDAGGPWLSCEVLVGGRTQ